MKILIIPFYIYFSCISTNVFLEKHETEIINLKGTHKNFEIEKSVYEQLDSTIFTLIQNQKMDNLSFWEFHLTLYSNKQYRFKFDFGNGYRAIELGDYKISSNTLILQSPAEIIQRKFLFLKDSKNAEFVTYNTNSEYKYMKSEFLNIDVNLNNYPK